MMGVLIPVMSRAISQDDLVLARRYVRGAVRFLIVVLLPICALSALGAETLMTMLYSSRYAGGTLFLQILVFGFGFAYALLISFCAMLIASGMPLLAAAIMLALIPLEVLVQYLAIPIAGGTGAAVAVTAVMSLGASIAGGYVYWKIGALVAPIVLLKVALATACITIVGMLLELSGPLLLIGYSGLLGLYAVILMVLGELTRGDLRPLLFWRSATVSEVLSDP
jgi:O-antigen/teichoic acid export membrane protein